MSDVKKQKLELLTNEEMITSIKNDLKKKELQYEMFKRMITEAEKEYKDFMAQPKEGKKKLEDFGKWGFGQAEIGQYKMQRENVRRDILMAKEYISILSEDETVKKGS